MALDESQIRDQINAVFMEKFEIPLDQLTPEKHLYEDLGLDSLDAVDMAIEFQRKFQVKLAKEDFVQIRKLEDVYALVSKFKGEMDA